MTTRFLIAIVAHACVIQVSRLQAQSQGPDNFIPTAPPRTVEEASPNESRAFKYTLLLPNEKSSEAVKEVERNPFGKSDDELLEVDGKSSNEETKIQEQLSKLSATGFSPGPDGLRVLFGDMWLSKNDTMPPVVKDQTLTLRVKDISREAIQVFWVEKKFTGLPPRMLVIPVDLRATVRRVPHGQVPEKNETKRESLASKRATAVEMPMVIAGNTTPAEARKAAQLALARLNPTASRTPEAKAPEARDAANTVAAPVTVSYAETQTPTVQTIDELAPAKRNIGGPEIAGPPAPVAETQAPMIATQPDATAGKTPATPAADDSPTWKRAMGLMDNLVKLSEANK